jgi:hypothetical protein
MLDRNCDSTPDSRTSVIALCFKVVGTPVGLRFGGVSVAVDHQHRDTPNVDLPYHSRKDSRTNVAAF